MLTSKYFEEQNMTTFFFFSLSLLFNAHVEEIPRPVSILYEQQLELEALFYFVNHRYNVH